MAEQPPCKRQVVGSIPTVSSGEGAQCVGFFSRGPGILVGYPSGQREQTVNLPAHAFEGSNPSPTTLGVEGRRRSGEAIAPAGVAQLVERKPSKLDVAGSSPVSRSLDADAEDAEYTENAENAEHGENAEHAANAENEAG